MTYRVSRPTFWVRPRVYVVLAILLAAGPLAAEEPIRLAGRRVSFTPRFEPEGRSRELEANDPQPMASTTVGDGDTVVSCVAYAPDGSSLAVGDRPNRALCTMFFLPNNENGGLIRIIDPATRQVTKTLRPAKVKRREYEVLGLIYSPDGKSLLAHGKEVWRLEGGGYEVGYHVTAWDLAKGVVVRRIESDRLDDWENVTFAPDASAFAARTKAGLCVWDIAKGLRPAFEAAPLKPTVLAFSLDGKTIAAGEKNGEIGLWETATGIRLARFPGHQRGKNAFEVGSLAFATDGRTLASTGLLRNPIAQFHVDFASELRLFDLETRAERATIASLEGGRFFDGLAYSPDCQTLALAVSDGGGDDAVGGVRLIDVGTGIERAATTTGHRGTKVAFSRDGSLLVTADQSWITLRNPLDGRERVALSQEGFGFLNGSIALSPDGQTLTTTNGRLQVWDLRAASESPTIGGHRFEVTGLAYSSDGRTLASSSVDRTVKLWDLASKTPRTTLVGHGAAIMQVAFAPDGRAVASVDSHHEVRIWDSTTGACRATILGPKMPSELFAFDPDGGSLRLIAHDDLRPVEVSLWDSITGAPMPKPHVDAGQLRPFAYSPDGGLIVLAGGSRVEVRDAASGDLRSRFPLEAGPLSLLVSNDGTTIVRMTNDLSLAIHRKAGDTWREEKLYEPEDADEFEFGTAPPGRYLAATPDFRRVAAAITSSVHVFDTKTRKPVAIIPMGEEEVSRLALSPDGSSLVTGHSNGDILIHDLNKAAAIPPRRDPQP